ncbi:hypothetical protein POSPLADRAFT_1065611 [Postia placenta MAD-698-R-SB12]|uniref:Uncharacterized protein n=1 Tax=Postia placenta MAD-698-R-SB12 TaxID=670580 RepID=A0A1X6N7A4_9APHY|nr:hypothetical protein POSPLADRAFT_1065611 [Postia placenta MAD-698-R-SB12]OSX64505.1 hypothetical protein POSPLADRAFT_1065611 [Postia placenta MAD-698-R-SB12]
MSSEKSQATVAAAVSPTPAWRGYWKLTRLHLWPAGTILFFWPCIWGITMTAYAQSLPPKIIAVQGAVYLLGCTIRHNAACVWNDICDRDFDRQVERTKIRPIASGAISIPAALGFLAAHLVAFIGILALAGPEALKIGLFGLFTFEAIYPLSKRFTHWPQAWLGFDCAWGFPVVWVSNNPNADLRIIAALVLGVVCWTIHFDTVYACQDKEDDVNAGVHSCALLFGDYLRPILSVFAAGFVASLAYVGVLNGQGPLYFAVTVGGAALHMLWQLTRPDMEKEGGKIWRSNNDLGYVIWGGMLLDYAHKLMVA